MLELEYESKIIKKLLVIKEICFWLQTFRPSNLRGSQANLEKNLLFSTLILGSVFNDYVVFYRDISLILLWAMRVQIRHFWLFLAHVFYNYNLAFNLIYVVLELT